MGQLHLPTTRVFILTVIDHKESRRKEAAALPIEEKIKSLIKLQKMIAPILAARGIHKRVWKLYDDEVEDVKGNDL